VKRVCAPCLPVREIDRDIKRERKREGGWTNAPRRERERERDIKRESMADAPRGEGERERERDRAKTNQGSAGVL
jgi:hypothetical protein